MRGLRGPPAGPGGLLPRSTPQAPDAQRPAVEENHAGVGPDPEQAVEGPQQGGSRFGTSPAAASSCQPGPTPA